MIKNGKIQFWTTIIQQKNAFVKNKASIPIKFQKILKKPLTKRNCRVIISRQKEAEHCSHRQIRSAGRYSHTANAVLLCTGNASFQHPRFFVFSVRMPIFFTEVFYHSRKKQF
jgi:hypothetical protein